MIAKVRHPIPYRCALWVISRYAFREVLTGVPAQLAKHRLLRRAPTTSEVAGLESGLSGVQLGPGSRSGSENWPGLNGRSYHVASSRAFRSAGAMTSVSRQATSIWSSV